MLPACLLVGTKEENQFIAEMESAHFNHFKVIDTRWGSFPARGAPRIHLADSVPHVLRLSPVPTAWQCRRTDEYQDPLPLPPLLPQKRETPTLGPTRLPRRLPWCSCVAPRLPHAPGGKTTCPYLIQPKTGWQDRRSDPSEHENSGVSQPSDGGSLQ